MKKLFTGMFLFACLGSHAQETTVKMKPLFNGKNLDGWYSFLRSKGKNNDPDKVFNIEMDCCIFQEKSSVIFVLKRNLAIIILWRNLNGV